MRRVIKVLADKPREYLSLENLLEPCEDNHGSSAAAGPALEKIIYCKEEPSSH